MFKVVPTTDSEIQSDRREFQNFSNRFEDPFWAKKLNNEQTRKTIKK